MRVEHLQYDFQLRQVFHLSELGAPEDGIDIVIVPGLWLRHATDKTSKRCTWLKLLVASTDQDTRIFVFKFDIKPDEKSGRVWHQLIALGRQLLDEIRQARPHGFTRRPLYFIVHSLGCVILKQAMYLAHRGDYPEIQNALSGIIFLGSPHLRSTDDVRWDNWKLILKYACKDLHKTGLYPSDIKDLAQVCNRFSELCLKIPIMSVYETTPSRVRGSGRLGWLWGSNHVLVDKALARVGMEQEELIGVSAPHEELQFVPQGTALFDRLVEYLSKAPIEGLALVQQAYDRLDIGPDMSDTYSRTWESWPRGHPLTPDGVAEPFRLIDLTPRPKRVLLPCHSLGSNRNPNFVARADILAQIDEAFIANSTAEGAEAGPYDTALPTAFALCGMGGMGKSEIALEYIHTRKASFDAVFWVKSDTVQKLDASFRDISAKLGLQTHEATLTSDPVTVRNIVKAWLENPVWTIAADPPEQNPDVRWLLVFDNAEDPDILYDYWPETGSGSILLTSRSPLANQRAFRKIGGVDLDPMSTQDSIHLLAKASGRDVNRRGANVCVTIAKKMGGLPLALVQMGSLMRIKHLTFSEFVEYYKENAKKLQESSVRGLTNDQTVASVWHIEALPRAAAALLRILSVLDPDSIPEDILIKGASGVDYEDYPKTKSDYLDAREALIRSSLVTRNMELSFLKIHRLVQDVVRQKLSIGELRAVFDTAVTLVSAVWPFLDASNLNEVDRLRKVQGYFPQVAAFRSILEDSTSEVLKPSARTAALLNEAAWLFVLQSSGYRLREGAAFAKLSLQVLDVPQDEVEPRSLSKLLADAYRYQGILATYMDSELAVPSCKKWIAILVDRVEKYQEESDIRTLPIAYNELGMALMRIHEEKEALSSWEMSCDTIPRVTPSGDLPFPFPWMHWALVTSYGGNPDAGYAKLQPIIHERERKLGKDDTATVETGILLAALGNIRQLQGFDNEGFNLHRRAASVLRVTTGENSNFTASANYHYGCDLFNRREYKSAGEYLQKCVDFAGDVPWYKPDAARASWKLAKALIALGGQENEDSANELLSNAMRWRHEIVPDDDRGESELRDIDWDEHVYHTFR